MVSGNKKTPKLILVGAGPGDIELITVKATKALQSADVVLYDALANEALLTEYAPNAQHVFVGKRKGLHHVQQYYINKMIVRYARKYGTVVRLKGGDPFVFGRGFEEMEYVMKHGVETSYVPGISSAFAVAPLAGIPLSVRGVNAGITIVTATASDGSLTEELGWAVAGKGTVIILMGVSKLNEIAQLVSTNRGHSEVMAVISKGSQQDERKLFAPAWSIYKESMVQGIETPAIIVVGKVVASALQLIESQLAAAEIQRT
ncbi:MAG: uroporphyrinogen-III C-methyltransferase [Imperialibacter sp.]|uniref:uroporphyrinogen-III C-methyltransferase n=1 Tax=Imperialibacter sp. TaxID=2038411 RepID=UPI003A8BD2A4